MRPVETEDPVDAIDEIELVSMLTKLHAPAAGGEATATRGAAAGVSALQSPAPSLERALLQRHAALYGGDGASVVAGDLASSSVGESAGGSGSGSRSSAAVRPRNRILAWTFRLAIACAALSVTVGAAAAIPAEIEAPVGWAVTIELPARTQIDVDELLQHVADVSSGDQISIALQRRSDQDPLTLSIDVWGGQKTMEQVLDDLYARVPALRDAPLEQRAIKGRMQTSLGGRIGFDVLGHVPDRALQEARALARLERNHALARQRTVAARFQHNGKRGLKIMVFRQESHETRLEF